MRRPCCPARLRRLPLAVALAEADVRVAGRSGIEDVPDAADAVVVLTPHTKFDLELVRRDAALVLDTRAALPPGDNTFRL